MTRGNRPLIEMECHCQELNHRLGTDDLESAAQELFNHRCRGADIAGECREIVVTVDGDFTDEEIDAVKWKLNMHRTTASSIVKFMARLSEITVSSLVVEYKSVVAEPPAPKAKKHQYIVGKNPPWHAKKAALHQFFRLV